MVEDTVDLFVAKREKESIHVLSNRVAREWLWRQSR